MQLIADRFALDERGRAVDLATGARVTLIVEPAGHVSQQLPWSERCETLHTMRHPAIAPLVDFGLTGPASRFEAWACTGVWRGSPDVARNVCARARRILRATGLSIGDPAADVADTARDGAGIWLPDAGSGYPSAHAEASHPELPLSEHGIRLIDRPAVAALAEVVRTQSGSRSPIVRLFGARESGLSSAVDAIARAARLAGFIPVAAALLDSRAAPLWNGRSLLVIAADPAPPAWCAFVRTSLRIAQPHVLLMVADTECRTVEGVPLRALPAGALVDAVRPRVTGGPHEAAVRAAAEQAHGLPGRFARRVWRRPREQRPRRIASARRTMRAAEQPAAYGVEDAAPPTVVGRDDVCAWPAPGELAALRRRVDTGLTLLAAGRHASGMRELRTAVGGLARRGAWIDAAAGSVHLASALLRRGRPADAQKVIDDAQDWAGRGGDGAAVIDLATLAGDAWIDRARLDEAEGILATAAAAARALGDAARAGAATLAMSRCLWWRGRYTEAADALARCPSSLPRRLQARRAALASKIAIALGDVAAAMAAAADASAHGDASGHSGVRSGAMCARAFAHLAAGDVDAADRELTLAIDAAHTARDPLRALRARLLRAEAARRRGLLPEAAAQLARLRRAAHGAPPLLRLRWQLLSALCARADVSPSAVVDRHIAATGLGALAVYASARQIATPAAAADPFLDHVVSILHVCQTAEDDAVVLKDVCVRVRHHLHALSVAFVSTRGGQRRIIASDGPRVDSDIAERAAGASITIAPHRRDDRVEAAAPVRYGGASIAAICARWSLGSTYDTSRAASVLAMTAAAAAPVVAIAIETRERERTAAPDETELLGVSTAMAELRRSVAAAASAPFAVLIDGESGSGKELVARAMHRGSARRQKPFCTLNCAALPEDLVEAELFGHARGSFTGAVLDRAGVFEDAHGGTLFLDEIGELSARAQAKVLRVIQEGELRRVGETASRRIDVRIVAATNRELRAEVADGRFRLDLLYRLDVIHIAVPPLRDRRDDVPVLAEHFWRDSAARVGSRAALGAATIAALARYDWPGNVRELQNVLAALAVRCAKRGVVPPSALPPAFTAPAAASASRLDQARRTFEERFVRAALVRTGGHRARAAEELGVTRQGLTKLMTRLGIAP